MNWPPISETAAFFFHRRRTSAPPVLPTARTTLRTGYVRVLVFCNSCRHQADADLQFAST